MKILWHVFRKGISSGRVLENVQMLYSLSKTMKTWSRFAKGLCLDHLWRLIPIV